ncbi:MAG: hypothetical protein LUQ56_06785 [Methylococcaceae bacterium]|nr:hypothetical protein [Methylococcaceae bacterium]MDD1642271.1 hypothetical protein [Methylococcaceae bacterium]
MLVGLVQRNPTTLVVLRWVTLSLGNSSCIAVPSPIIHMDVVNADIAGANICPCSLNPTYCVLY